MKRLPWRDPARVARLDILLSERIAILDGAMGTMIQRHPLDEKDFRGERFAQGHDSHRLQGGHEHHGDCGCAREQRGNNDLLSLTRPDLIGSIHAEYLAAGADLIETNTFNSTAISLEDYGLAHLARELNVAGAALARSACDAAEAAAPGRSAFVVGVLGPTSRTASISPDVNRPGYRAISFDQLRTAYRDAVDGLLEGGADLLMVETVFDTLNAKAALFAIEEAFDACGTRVPVTISGTITDASGRTLSGQTAEAFWISIQHAHPFSIGLNCALGARDLRAHVDVLAQSADTFISCHPNAGLPNAFGGYDESPDDMASTLREFAQAGLLNIVGGCCGTTPEHIAAIAAAVRDCAPRSLVPRGIAA